MDTKKRIELALQILDMLEKGAKELSGCKTAQEIGSHSLTDCRWEYNSPGAWELVLPGKTRLSLRLDGNLSVGYEDSKWNVLIPWPAKVLVKFVSPC